MAITPEIDALVARIDGLESLIGVLDGVQPIVITVGSFNFTVDPAIAPDAYARGADVLKGQAQATIIELRNRIASTAIAQSQSESAQKMASPGA
jgi:hypothetical protein